MVYRIDTGWQARKRRIVFNETALQNPRFLTSLQSNKHSSIQYDHWVDGRIHFRYRCKRVGFIGRA